MNVSDLRLYVIRPVCQHLDLWTPAAENLVLGTALVESGGEHLHQVRGPALGLFQMEPASYYDLWANYIRGRPALVAKLEELQTPASITQGAFEMIGNLYYAAAMCRVFYRRVREPLPGADDAEGLAAYWKRFYNTERGAGTVERALPHFQEVCAS